VVDQGLRARVERLLSAEFRPDDLTRLFLYARDRCDGRESVQEVGDFVAHKDERTKGLITRTTRDWFENVRFAVPVIMGNKPDAQNLPPNFPDVLSAMLRRLDGPTIKGRTGINLAEAHGMVPGIIKKLVKRPSGFFSFPENSFTMKEAALLDCLTSYIVSKTAFDGERLFVDLSATLKSHSLLHKSELKAFEELRPRVSLFAVTVMHNCTVRLQDGSAVKLQATKDERNGIAIMAPVPVLRPDGSEIRISSAIFSSGVDAASHCGPELLAMQDGWPFDLELTPNGLLDKLG
jgi:hypothetical protein